MPPLSGDFVTDSILLEESWRGALSEELVPLEGHTEERTQGNVDQSPGCLI